MNSDRQRTDPGRILGKRNPHPQALTRPALSRRRFLGTAAVSMAALCGPAFSPLRRSKHFTGSIVGGNVALGHALRDGKFPAISETRETGIVVVGGGIAGLAAARRLHKKGFSDFMLLELESRPGGNAINGQNTVSAYPWGAHYVPIAGSDSKEVRELFEDLGVITGQAANGLPIYNEEYLCADPMERLFLHGRWQEGFVPQLGVSRDEQQEMQAFLDEMHRLQNARGQDGRRAFTIPLDDSSRDEQFTRLDAITMREYLEQKGWLTCRPLHWYVNYCCRDDYGAGIDQVSAWAGLHYFASRDGRAANAPGYSVVTWPEGNGWFVRRLQSEIADKVHSSCAVWNIESRSHGTIVDYYDDSLKRSVRLHTRGVVWSAPHFIAQRALKGVSDQPGIAVQYSPWMVANLTLNAMPTGLGMDLAWDNVLYDSNSLGYVVATHQNLTPVPRQTVLTYYQPLDDDAPPLVRQKALARSYEQWCDQIISDLRQAHPDIGNHISNLDVWLWGHAMVRPVPGFIWGAGRSRMQQPLPGLVFAHSDLSGIAIFEEAYTRGVRAADTLLEQLDSRTQRL